MKLTKYTDPQAKDYMCDECKILKSHINMHNDKICYNCFLEVDRKK